VSEREVWIERKYTRFDGKVKPVWDLMCGYRIIHRNGYYAFAFHIFGFIGMYALPALSTWALRSAFGGPENVPDYLVDSVGIIIFSAMAVALVVNVINMNVFRTRGDFYREEQIVSEW